MPRRETALIFIFDPARMAATIDGSSAAFSVQADFSFEKKEKDLPSIVTVTLEASFKIISSDELWFIGYVLPTALGHNEKVVTMINGCWFIGCRHRYCIADLAVSRLVADGAPIVELTDARRRLR